MIRALLVYLVLASSVVAQNTQPELPDITQLRASPDIDFSLTFPLGMQQAFAAAEDKNFFDTFPSFSTITRQVARNYLLSGTRSMTRVAMEMRLAVDIANEFSHDEIMTIWLQSLYLGRGCYGADAALEHLFGRPMTDATLADSITLAAAARAPSLYDRDPDLFKPRFDAVVRSGFDAGFWDSPTEIALLKAGPTPFLPGSRCPMDF